MELLGDISYESTYDFIYVIIMELSVCFEALGLLENKLYHSLPRLSIVTRFELILY